MMQEARDKEWIKTGDDLLGNGYWAGKFSTPEIRKFWEQLKQEALKKPIEVKK